MISRIEMKCNENLKSKMEIEIVPEIMAWFLCSGKLSRFFIVEMCSFVCVFSSTLLNINKSNDLLPYHSLDYIHLIIGINVARGDG